MCGRYHNQPLIPINLPDCAVVDEVSIVFYQRGSFGKKKKLFQLWFHTAFIPVRRSVRGEASGSGEGGSRGRSIVLKAVACACFCLLTLAALPSLRSPPTNYRCWLSV